MELGNLNPYYGIRQPLIHITFAYEFIYVLFKKDLHQKTKSMTQISLNSAPLYKLMVALLLHTEWLAPWMCL